MSKSAREALISYFNEVACRRTGVQEARQVVLALEEEEHQELRDRVISGNPIAFTRGEDFLENQGVRRGVPPENDFNMVREQSRFIEQLISENRILKGLPELREGERIDPAKELLPKNTIHRWINLYSDGTVGYAYESEEKANEQVAGYDRTKITRIKLTGYY